MQYSRIYEKIDVLYYVGCKKHRSFLPFTVFEYLTFTRKTLVHNTVNTLQILISAVGVLRFRHHSDRWKATLEERKSAVARGIINCTQKVANRINYPWPAGASFSYFLLYLPFLSFFPFFFLSCRCCFSREILPSHSRGSTINHLSLGNCLEV